MRRELKTVVAAVAVALALALVPAAGARAQQIDLQLQEIRTLVREKRYPLALESLRLVARQIQDLRLEAVAPAFPEAPNGWTASAPLSLLDENDVWSDRIEAQRSYASPSGGARIDVVLAVHSPAAAAVALSLNPLAIEADPHSRPIEIAGFPARVRYVPDAGEGEVRVLLAREVLVTVRGRGVASADPLVELAGRVDYAVLQAKAGL